MATGSRLKAIDQALKTVIAARTPGLTGVQVERGHPGELLQREAVWVDRILLEEDFKYLAATNQRKLQKITAQILVRVRADGDDAAALRDRALDVADEVEEALRGDISLSGAADFGGVQSGEVDSFTDTDGRVCAIRLDATYTARKG
jgi:hypothetical protein